MTTKIMFAGLCIAAGLASCIGASKTKGIVTKVSQEEHILTATITSDTATELGKIQVHSYKGLLPAASCPGIEYKLTIRNREHSGDGTFQLTLTYKEAENGEDRTFTYKGKRLTMRGIPGDDNATVWQCIADGNNQIFNFLRVDENTLTLLNDKCEKAQTDLNYSLKLVE